MPADAPPDPRPGEKWEHRDGGTIYVIHRTLKMVLVNRRPGDDTSGMQWIRLSTFAAMTSGRLL